MKDLVGPILMGICMATGCSNSMPGAAPDLELSASSLMFGQEVVGQPSSAQPVTLRNTGTGTLQITSIVVSTNFQATNDCGGSLAAGASCTINVTFTPSISGSVDGQIMVTDNAVGSPHSVRLSGDRKRQRTALYAEGDAVPGSVSALLPRSELCARVDTCVLRVAWVTLFRSLLGNSLLEGFAVRSRNNEFDARG